MHPHSILGTLICLGLLLCSAGGPSVANGSPAGATLPAVTAGPTALHGLESADLDPAMQVVRTEDDAPMIDTVMVIGNKITQDFVVFAEMELDAGDIATEDALRRDTDRLESLHLFSRAELKFASMTRGRTALVVEVTELWYIWPGLYLDVDEDDPSRTSVGGIISHDNFRGRRETLSVSGRYGYISGFEFDWTLPYLSSSSPDWSMRIDGSFTNEQEPRFLKDREGVESRDRSLAARVGYRFSLEDYTWLQATVRSRAFRSDGMLQDWLTVSDGDQDVLGQLELGVERDTRTYKPWPENAFVLHGILGVGAGLNHSGTSFLRPELMGAYYHSPRDRLTLAGRVNVASYLGGAPSYERVLLDRQNGIRTSMETTFEGTWRILSTAEVRVDLLPVRYLTFDIWEPVNPYTRNLKFGVSSALFVDHGIVGGVQQPSPFSDDTETSGWDLAYGLGLILHIPYRDMLRVEVMRSAHFPDSGLSVRLRIGTFF